MANAQVVHSSRQVSVNALAQLVLAPVLSVACAQVPGPPVPPVVHHLAHDVADAGVVPRLPKAVVVIVVADANSPERVSAFAAAAMSAPQDLPATSKLALLSTGPLLDQPDEVAGHPLKRDGNRFTLDVVYTSARATGRNLERNLRWLPLVEASLPDRLAPGEYVVSVTWRAVRALTDPVALPLEPLAEETRFFVRSR